MHRRVFKEFEKICSERKASGRILEIGAVPNDNSLLNIKSLKNTTEKIGINLEGPYRYKDFTILKGNANSMTCFKDGYFDTILCNAMLEHDKFFWKTISEIKRVTKSGGLIVIGAPGYKEFIIERYVRNIFKIIPPIRRYLNFLLTTTITFYVHNYPGDYYRYSMQAFKEVFFSDMVDVKIYSIMIPPRIIGSGIKQ